MWLILISLTLSLHLPNISSQNIDVESLILRAKKLIDLTLEIIDTLELLNRKEEASIIKREELAIYALVVELENQLSSHSSNQNELKQLEESLKVREDVLESELKNLGEIITTTTTKPTITTVPTTIKTTTTLTPTTTVPTITTITPSTTKTITRPVTTTTSVPSTTTLITTITTTKPTTIPTTITTTKRSTISTTSISTSKIPDKTTTILPITTSVTLRPFSCDDSFFLIFCDCYVGTEKQSYIRCNKNNFGDEELKQLSSFEFPKALVKELQICGTYITRIPNNTFINIQFVHIFIESNSRLIEIEKNAFTQSFDTKLLVIRNNTNLYTSGLFGLAHNFRYSLEQIVFDRNNITRIPSGALSNFPNVKYIYLHNQSKALTVIEKSSINVLPKLLEIHLQFNQISIIEENAIDFWDIKQNAVIYLNDNKIDEKSLTTNTINLDHNNANIYLIVENNLIKSVYNNELFKLIVSASNTGMVYLKGNPIQCNCVEVAKQDWMKSDKAMNNILGLKDIKCLPENKTLSQCLLL